MKLLIVLLIIFTACCLLAIGGIWGYQKYKHHQESKFLQQLPHDDLLAKNLILEEHGDVKIGDNKMTVKEKLDANLNPYVEDTSGNGISDWDAIHTYDLDPTKFSTADDGISDFAKIEEDLDPTKPIDPKEIDDFVIDDEKLKLSLHTNDLNAKYHSTMEAYEQDELETLFEPAREPVRIKNYEGEVQLDLPKKSENPKDLKAYYFNLETEELEKIKKQRIEDDLIYVTIDQSFPIYIIDPDVLETMNEYYYFRISLFDLGRSILGYDHNIILYKRGLFTDKEFVDETMEDVDYGIIQFSHATISKVHAFLLDRLFQLLDLIFTPFDEHDINIMAKAFFDYGKFEGTPELAKRYTMPWLYEHEEIETENDWSSKVVDSGFRTKVNAFAFGNFKTEIASGGVCAGIVRVTEMIYNGEGLEEQMIFEPNHWTNKVIGESKGYTDLEYDLTDTIDAYPFLDDGVLYDYELTDPTVSHIAKGDKKDADLYVKPNDLNEPDRSLMKMLETQWIYSNDIISTETPLNIDHPQKLDQIEDLLANQQVIYVTLHGSDSGHAVTVYKMEYDRYDEDHIRLYVYDPNLPQALLKKYGIKEAYIDIYLKEKDIMYQGGIVENRSYFEFDYAPLKAHREDYSYSNMQGNDSINFYHSDKAIK